MQDVVDPVADEMLAKFVVDSHFKSQPKGANIEDKSLSESQEDVQTSGDAADPEVCPPVLIFSLIYLLFFSFFFFFFLISLLNLILCF